jgi:flagellar basal-body rod modification protein FlgD
MDVHVVSSQKFPPSSTTTGSAATKAAEAGRDTFLRLLIAQLEHQDPLSPMENADFTTQLAQFSTLEQIEAMNTNLQAFLSSQEALNDAQAGMHAASLIGKDVQVRGNTMRVQQGEASRVSYTLAANSSEVSIRVFDQTGTLVQSLRRSNQPAGAYEIPRSGKDSEAIRLPDGSYRVEVIALDSTGQPVAVETLIQGRVEGVEYIEKHPHFLIGGNRTPVSEVVSIRENKN